MNNCFIILAAGESKRFNSNTPKPYHIYRGKPLIMHSIDKALDNKKFNKIVVVVNKKHKKYFKMLKLKHVNLINGGKTRAGEFVGDLACVRHAHAMNLVARAIFAFGGLKESFGMSGDAGIREGTQLRANLGGVGSAHGVELARRHRRRR